MPDRSSPCLGRPHRPRVSPTVRRWVAWVGYVVGTVVLLLTMRDEPFARYLAAQFALFLVFIGGVASVDDWSRAVDVLQTVARNVRWRWQDYRRGPVGADSPISQRLRALLDEDAR